MLLYLDYDGVLHPEHVYLINGRPVLKSDGRLFMWSDTLVEILAPHPDVEIVLSTSWVKVRGFDRAKQALPAELQRRVIGATWHSQMRQDWFESRPRYSQIFSDAMRRDRAWLAIDDDVYLWPPKHHDCLIQTDGADGLSAPEVQQKLRNKLRGLE